MHTDSASVSPVVGVVLKKNLKTFTIFRNDVYDIHTESESVLQSAMACSFQDRNPGDPDH